MLNYYLYKTHLKSVCWLYPYNLISHYHMRTYIYAYVYIRFEFLCWTRFCEFGPLDFCTISTQFLLFVLPLCRWLFSSMDGELCQKWPGETHILLDLEALNIFCDTKINTREQFKCLATDKFCLLWIDLYSIKYSLLLMIICVELHNSFISYYAFTSARCVTPSLIDWWLL